LGDWLYRNDKKIPFIERNSTTEQLYDYLIKTFIGFKDVLNKDDLTFKNGTFEQVRDIIRSTISKLAGPESMTKINEEFETWKNKSLHLKHIMKNLNNFYEDIIFFIGKDKSVPSHAAVSLVQAIPGEEDRDLLYVKSSESQSSLKAGSPCSGDSGGPLILKSGNSFVQFGIAAEVIRPPNRFLKQCKCSCDLEADARYVRVTKHLDWIMNHLRENNAMPSCRRK